MVTWFDPVLLLRTLVQLLVARVFATFADRRERDAGRPHDGPYRYDGTEELWLDYVSDLGDGWNPTATVAGLLSAHALDTAGKHLAHGRVLLMGGDQVYPAASREEYLHRLESPYYSLHPFSPPDSPRDLFSLPGNHDWYDGLAAFSRLFLQGRWFAGWRTRQSRSYFVLRLPQRWWLVAVDVQLDNDIDMPQLKYLEAAVEDMQPGDSVILLAAVPFWLEEKGSTLRRNLAFLQRRLVDDRKAHVRLSLAGDLHHYQRYAHADGRQYITAGGGGAFLHGTAWHADTLDRGSRSQLDRAHSFPGPGDSRLALWRLLGFPYFNFPFTLFLGALLALLLWGVQAASNGIFAGVAAGGVLPAIFSLVETLPASPLLCAAMAGWFAAFIGFEEPPGTWPTLLKRAARPLLGTVHGALQLLLALWLGSAFLPQAVDGPLAFFPQLVLLALVLAPGAGLLFGGWLFVMYQVFGGHRDSAFSACRIQDWKNFLRLHVARDGTLHVYAIGIRRVCRRWRMTPSPREHGPRVEPADGVPLAARAHLIEHVPVSPATPRPAEKGA